ncbi:LANO_0E14444g1_1 [Lachancea nothofagi CBS 11611]|uniref:LANO_0E14444g1_1 n=1 Tax=Lachancea nothofagi CBS 11611 TaxID=1266666 RepID=A0A1G4K019_9SACH|nr:LANO_0E14444g1_1 [Lachancea nothofagi CBS 11611]
MAWFRRYLRIPQELRPSEVFKQDSLSPLKITLQIVLLQLFYYATAYVLFYVWANLGGYDVPLSQWLFSWEPIEFSNSLGLTLSLLWLLDSLICVLFLTVIVGRSKLAWDFGITIHAVNLLIVLIKTGKWPSLAWFVVQFLSSLILVFLGTWSTRWRELRDTFFEGLVDPQTATATMSQHEVSAEDNLELKDLEAQK